MHCQFIFNLAKKVKVERTSMEWLLNEIYILGGVSLGLFLAICLYGYKKMCMEKKGRKNYKQKYFDENEDFKIEEWKSELDDEDSCGISIASSIRMRNNENVGQKQQPKESLPISLLANVLNDLSDKLQETKQIEENIKSHERKMKKLTKLNIALEKRVSKLEAEVTKKDPFSNYASLKSYKTQCSRQSYCACKPGDKEACI